MLRLFELDWEGGGQGHPLEHPRIVLVIIFFIFHMVTVFLVLRLLSPSPLFLGPNVLFSQQSHLVLILASLFAP